MQRLLLSMQGCNHGNKQGIDICDPVVLTSPAQSVGMPAEACVAQDPY